MQSYKKIFKPNTRLRYFYEFKGKTESAGEAVDIGRHYFSA